MNKEAYIGGPTGGVPEDIFNKPQKGEFEIEGKSGATLKGHVWKREIKIKPAGSKVVFKARLGIDNSLDYDIETKDPDKQFHKHPDLYAAKLAKRAHDFFIQNGANIERLDGLWGGGDNFATYYEYLNNIEKERPITEEDKKEAARRTWTGQLASSLGYTEVADVRGGGRVKSIFAVFTKPK